MRGTLPMLDVRTTELGEGHRVASINLTDAIVRLLQEDAGVRQQMVSKSEEWKLGEKWKQPPPDVIREMDEGSVARNHAHLMRPAGPGEERDLRVGVILYADEVEVCATAHPPFPSPPLSWRERQLTLCETCGSLIVGYSRGGSPHSPPLTV
jgi:hypothetical protein